MCTLWTHWGILLLIVGTLSACIGNSPAAKVEKTQEQEAPVPVTVVPARIQEVQRTVEFVGTLFANEEVTIASEVEGRIANISADLGDRVVQGQVLAKIEDTEFRLAVAQAEGNLRETLARLGLQNPPQADFDVTATSLAARAKAERDDAQAHLKRVMDLYQNNLVAAQERDTAATRAATALASYDGAIEEARALLASARSKAAHLAVARKKLHDTLIVAPLSGAISQRIISPGEYVKVGDPLFTLVQDQPLRLRGMIPERFAPAVQHGQRVDVQVDAFPGQTFQGTLARISPSANISSRSFLIEALIDNTDHFLKPNFFANAVVLTHTAADAVTVPQQALMAFAGVTKVFIIADGLAHEREIQAGSRVGTNEVEITSGLKRGDLVAVSGLTRLSDGTTVTVLRSEAFAEELKEATL